MNEKVKNLLIRSVSGILLAVVMLGATIWSIWSFGALLLLILIGGMLEVYGLTEKQGDRAQKFVGLTAGITFFALTFFPVYDWIFHDEFGKLPEYWFVILVCFFTLLLPLIFFTELYRRNENPAGAIGATLLGIFYVAFPLSLMLFIPLTHNDGHGWWPWLVVIYIFLIWANDVFAYLVGMTIGRHALFKRISPKKSWEGFFGGLIGCIAISVAASYIVEYSFNPNPEVINVVINRWAWIGLAVVVTVTGVLGDLVESMFKRAAGVKDSGNIIPGHGGILDRFDAMLLSAPFVLVYLVQVNLWV